MVLAVQPSATRDRAGGTDGCGRCRSDHPFQFSILLAELDGRLFPGLRSPDLPRPVNDPVLSIHYRPR